MHKTSAFLIFAIMLLGACSRPAEQAGPKSTPEPAPAPLPLVQLPDFTALVDRYGAAVVNISTTQRVRNDRGFGSVPGIPEDDPFFEFFRRFMPSPFTPREFRTQSLGSGFIVDASGYILSNAHVVANADQITVKMTDKREFVAELVGMDARSDVAVLKIDIQEPPVVKVGNSEELKVGEWVVAIGAPFGFENSVTVGVVSATGRTLPADTYVPFIQTDVAVNPGNSGGPLFNLHGEVVGINAQIFSRTGGYMGVSFAIPIDVAMNVANQLREHGRVSRSKLGVEIQDLTTDLAASFGLPNSNGALVASVEDGSPADKGGLQPGDVILEYNGEVLASAGDLPLKVATTKPGTRVEIRLWRKGKEQRVTVTTGELTTEPAAQGQRKTAQPNRLGLIVRTLSPGEHETLRLDYGLFVERVQDAAAIAGIRSGDIILALNETKITDIKQFERLVKEAQGKSVALLVQREGDAVYIPVPISGER